LTHTACQGAKGVSRASKTIKHKTKCQACRWFLGPQKTWRSEVQEARSKDSRKGLLAFFLGKQFSETAWEPPTLLMRERGIEARLLHAQISTGPRRRKEPHTPKIVVRSYWKMGGSVTHTGVTNKSRRPRTTRASRRHPGNKLTSPTTEMKSCCNRLGFCLLRSGSLGKPNGTFTAD
jgi:hypothetical protein